MPPLSSIFLLALFRSKIIQSIDIDLSIPNALQTDPELGSHTDIFLFSSDWCSSSGQMQFKCNKYVWWNKYRRPFGEDLPLLCPVCTCIRPWGDVVHTKEAWAVECGNPKCGLDERNRRVVPSGKISKNKLPNLKFVTPRKRPQGWMVETVVDVQHL